VSRLSADHQDVPFDWGAAEKLAAAFRAAATTLESQVPARNTMAEAALAEWQGRFADEFQGRMATCADDGRRLAAAMRVAAGQVGELSDRASREQRRRQDARDWEYHERHKSAVERLTDDLGLTHKETPPPPQADPPPRFLCEAPQVVRT
jgi:uncharacterized protein YukE